MREVYQTQSGTEFKNDWSYISTVPSTPLRCCCY